MTRPVYLPSVRLDSTGNCGCAVLRRSANDKNTRPADDLSHSPADGANYPLEVAFSPSVVNGCQTGSFLSPSLRRLDGRPVVRTAVSTSGPPALLDDAIDAIMATARSPRERYRRAMVDIALVLVLRGCGLRPLGGCRPRQARPGPKRRPAQPRGRTPTHWRGGR